MPKKLESKKLEGNFTLIPNKLIRDERISFRARGIFIYCASHVDDWKLSIRSIARATSEGTSAVSSALKELEKFGYLSRERTKAKKGHFETTYKLSFEGNLVPYVLPPRKEEDKRLSKNKSKNNPNRFRDEAQQLVDEIWLPLTKGKVAQDPLTVVKIVQSSLKAGSTIEEIEKGLRFYARDVIYSGSITGDKLIRAIHGIRFDAKAPIPANRKVDPSEYSEVL